MGVDYSDRAIAFAKAFAPNVSFAARTDETFEAFILIEVLEHIPPAEMDVFLDNICKNLQPGAFGVLTTPHITATLEPKHFQHFSRELIQRTLGGHFEIVDFKYICVENWKVKLLQRLLVNRLFILRYPPLVAWIYEIYKKWFFIADETNAEQVFVVLRKK